MTDKGKDIVVNTSPWIALSTCGQIDLLKKLYADIYVPYHVKEEIMSGGKQGIGVHELKSCEWVKIEAIKPLVQKILEHGIWIKDEIVEGILKESGEKS